MSLSPDEIAFATELFSDLGGVTTRKMFGGLGLYRDGTIFAVMLSDGRLFLKGAPGFVPELEAAGCEQWVYERENGKTGAMPYWSLPDTALDDPEVACDWAARALTHL